MEFKISKELIQQVKELIQNKSDLKLEALLNDIHHADIAEILDELDFDDATYIFKVLDSDKTAEMTRIYYNNDPSLSMQELHRTTNPFILPRADN